MIYNNIIFKLHEKIPDITYNVRQNNDYISLYFVLYGYNTSNFYIKYENSILTIKTVDDYIPIKIDPKFSSYYPFREKFWINFLIPKIDGIHASYSESILKLKCHIGEISTNLNNIEIANYINQSDQDDLRNIVFDDTVVKNDTLFADCYDGVLDDTKIQTLYGPFDYIKLVDDVNEIKEDNIQIQTLLFADYCGNHFDKINYKDIMLLRDRPDTANDDILLNNKILLPDGPFNNIAEEMLQAPTILTPDAINKTEDNIEYLSEVASNDNIEVTDEIEHSDVLLLSDGNINFGDNFKMVKEKI